MPYASGRLWRTIGQGLSGIGRTIRDNRIEDDLLEQRRIEDERRRAREDLAQELMFVDRGGGMGVPPPLERMVPGTRPEIEFNAPELIPEPDIGVGLGRAAADRVGLMPEPAFGSVDTLTIEEPDPRYSRVGPGYVEKPGVAEDRARMERANRISSGVQGLLPDASPSSVRGIGQLMAEGVNASHLLQRPTAADRDVEWDTVTDADGNVYQLHPITGATRPTGLTERVPGTTRVSTPTYDQAMELLRERYAIFETPQGGIAPEFQGYSIPLEDMHQHALAMARGEDVQFPEPTQGPDRDPVIAPEPGFGGFMRRLMPGGETGYQLERPAVGAPDDFVPEPGLERVPSEPRPSSRSQRQRETITKDQADYLRVVKGMSDDEISRLYIVR